MPCPAPDAKDEQPSVAGAHIDDDIDHAVDRRLIDAPGHCRDLLVIARGIVACVHGCPSQMRIGFPQPFRRADFVKAARNFIARKLPRTRHRGIDIG